MSTFFHQTKYFNFNLSNLIWFDLIEILIMTVVDAKFGMLPDLIHLTLTIQLDISHND